MKLSIAVSTPDAAFSALALKGNYEDIFNLLEECGYDGVEISIKNPADFDADSVSKLLDRHGLSVPAIATGRAFGEEGLSFSSPDPDIRKRAVERIKAQIDLAHRFGALVIIGLIVGQTKRNEVTEALAVSCLSECAKKAEDLGVNIVVEPINRYESGFITDVDSCLSFLDKVGSPSCKVLFDTFHANIEEVSIEGSIRKAAARIGHVHVADSNRHHPGAGHTNFRSIIDTLSEIGYDGFLTAEILPLPDPETAARNNAAFMREILKGRNVEGGPGIGNLFLSI